MAGTEIQNSDYEFFIENIEKLYAEYGKKFIAIKNKAVLGAYNSFREAIDNTAKTEELGTFLVQECFENAQKIPAIINNTYFAYPIRNIEEKWEI